MRRGSEGGVWWASPRVAAVLSLAPAVLAIFIDAHQLTLHWALKGATFTADGTNVGSALLLTSGRLPYDNFVLAQPPGMTILMLPFAWAAHAASTNGAFSGARIATAVFAVLDVYLVGLVARHRGFAGSIVAGVTFAVYPFAFFATASAMLEPYLLFFCLVALLVAFPDGELTESGPRLVVVGVLLGYAITIKPWAIVPAAAILIAASPKWRLSLGRLIGGMAAGVIIPCLIFVLAAPGAFWHDVVVSELGGGSSGAHAPDAAGRLAQILGLGAPAGISNGHGLAVAITLVLAALVILLTIARLRLTIMTDWIVLGTAIALIVIAFIPSSIPAAYGWFVAAWLAIVLGTVVGNLLSLLSSLELGEGVGGVAASGISVLFVALCIGLIAVALPKETSYERVWFINHGINPQIQMAHVVPQNACALSDDPSVLIVADRLLGQPSGCPVIIDPAGVITAAGTSPADRVALRKTYEQAMNGSSFVILNPKVDGFAFDHALSAYFSHNFRLASHRIVEIYTNKSGSAP